MSHYTNIKRSANQCCQCGFASSFRSIQVLRLQMQRRVFYQLVYFRSIALCLPPRVTHTSLHLQPDQVCVPIQTTTQDRRDPGIAEAIHSKRTREFVPIFSCEVENVLDHLVYCKSNPAIDKCKTAQARRKQAKSVVARCEICSMVFNNLNTLSKHNSRHHRLAPESAKCNETSCGNLAHAVQMPNPETRSLLDMIADISDGEEPESHFAAYGLEGEDHYHPRPRIDSPTALAFATRTDLDEQICIKRLRKRSASVTSSNQPSSRQTDYGPPLLPPTSYTIVDGILARVSKADVRQPSGRGERNASEISLIGVTMMIREFGVLQSSDGFVDIRSGIGNVVLQVALESEFTRCVGVEMRKDLVDLAESQIYPHKPVHRRLGKIEFIHADIARDSVESLAQLKGATHLFCSNKLFGAQALHALEELYWLPNVRVVIVTERPCPRHTKRCTKSICRFWKLQTVLDVPMTYTSHFVPLYFFHRSVEM
jgi:hypothetical protein